MYTAGNLFTDRMHQKAEKQNAIKQEIQHNQDVRAKSTDPVCIGFY